MPILLRLLGSLAVIVLVNAWSRSLTIATLVGTVVFALWCGHPLWGSVDGSAPIPVIAWQALVDPDNLLLALTIFLLLWMSSLMASCGVMTELVVAVRARIGPRWAMAALPAVIGWLPMPGGAAFSAPMVNECDHQQQLPSIAKSVANYWFRHVWEYWWPLYPGVLLAISLTGLPMWLFVLTMLPLSLASIVVGRLTVLPRLAVADEQPDATPGGAGFLSLILPILVTVLLAAGLGSLVPGLAELNRYLPMVIGLIVGLMVLAYQRSIDAGQWRRVLLAPSTLGLVVLVLVIQIYGAFIRVPLPDGQPVSAVIRDELTRWGISPLAMVVLIPAAMGLVTGICIGFVGASFPVVLALMANDSSLGQQLSTAVLAYGAGYLGMLLSPVHVCLVVSNAYFKTSLYISIRLLLVPVTAMAVFVVGYWAVLRWGCG